jgi:hypothetical protein
MTEPRPKFSPEIALVVAKELAAKLAHDGLIDPNQIEASADDIVKYAEPHMDGYENARELEKWALWECDLRIAETLDEFSHLVANQIVAAEKEWAARNDIKPPLPCGARVSLPKKETGTIDRVYECGGAKYCVAIDGDPHAHSSTQRRRIVNFEDVSPA